MTEPKDDLGNRRRAGGVPAEVRLHAVEAGPPDGPLVILLHGFPEFSHGWRRQVGPLAEAGFRVLAPDQRGYNLSDKPGRVEDYRIDRLAGDVLRLADGAGRQRFSVVGHDWGGIVAWWLAIHHPDRLERAAILNAPHPATLARHMAAHPTQLLRSWYVAFFQIPGLPERLATAARFRLLERSMRSSSRPGTFTEDDLARYRAAWAQPGALTAMIDWYRALRLNPRPSTDRVRVPTLVIWGDRDAFLDRRLAEAAAALCDDARVEHLDAATHWVQHEEPERVNCLLIGFLRGGG
ncbi:alpha/beta hydrolase [Azospirillum sp. SYSU D00513]|uniref:alpha/beta fold hydrolase n=1 Tax=Azospirillum sp. SYSU D00513 TaxID=2812561 RepID=UPI001A96DDE5|nr:alpha/beta hydrolase [Azospirillum sp. SYSU D00513]